VFRDRRLDQKGGCAAGAAERYYSAEADLLLTYKYSRPDLTAKYLEHFRGSGDEMLHNAAAVFELREKSGRLPAQIDPDHMAAQFGDGGCAQHRFKVR